MKRKICIIAVTIIIIGVIILAYKKKTNSINKENNLNSNSQDYMLDGPDSEKAFSYDSSKYIEFTDNQCIAIGYVTDSNEAQFIERYFPDNMYEMLDYYDFRPSENRVDNYGNKFIIVPMNNDVKISVYDCYIGEDGELYTKNTLVSNATEPFILLSDYIEYTPIMSIKFEYNGFETMYPILFSGEDGRLDLMGYETEIKDISLY